MVINNSIYVFQIFVITYHGELRCIVDLGRRQTKSNENNEYKLFITLIEKRNKMNFYFAD